jgi:hypothetical protein
MRELRGAMCELRFAVFSLLVHRVELGAAGFL